LNRDLENVSAKSLMSEKKRQYESYLEEIVSYRKSNQMKDFHKQIQKLVKPNISGCIETLNVDNRETLHDARRIESKILDHYGNIFGCGKREKIITPHGLLGSVLLDEVRSALERISTNKALSHDLLPDTVLDHRIPELVDSMHCLVNYCFRGRFFPEEAAISRLHVINKDSGSQPCLSNLRPIMICSPLRKLMEAIILPKLEDRLITQKIIAKSQTGFMPGCGTAINLVKSVGDILEIKSRRSAKGKYFAVFVDFKAAFDSVRHEILYEKLEQAGIDSMTINRIKFLYNNAYFTVGRAAGAAPINVGVHQGSLISPILFNLYINDLLQDLGKLLGDSNVFCYADDLMFVVLGRLYMEKAVELIDSWGKKNGMMLNAKKCGIMKIQSRRGENSKAGSLDDIAFVEKYKYLGVIVDSCLSFEPQIAQLAKRLYGTYSNFYKLISKVVGVKLKLEIWKVYVKTIMEYGAELFALLPSKVKKLESIFYRTLTISLGLPKNTSRKRLIKGLAILDVQTVIKLRLLNTYRKMVKKELKIPEPVCEKIRGILTGFNMCIGDVQDIEAIEKSSVKNWINEHWGVQAEDLNYPDGLFKIGQEGDWDLLFTLAGRIIPKLYERNRCEDCGVLRDQDHILNDCVRHQDVRIQFKRKLGQIGIDIGGSKSISERITGLQSDCEVRGLEGSKREELLTIIGGFLKEVRSVYLQ
jgi:putative lipoic acid-binding regulatory protein